MLITVLLISGQQKIPSTEKNPRKSWTSILKHSLIDLLVLLQSYRKYNTTRAKHYWLHCIAANITSIINYLDLAFSVCYKLTWIKCLKRNIQQKLYYIIIICYYLLFSRKKSQIFHWKRYLAVVILHCDIFW